MNKKKRTMSHFEPDPINYVSVPTLKTMATVRVATALCMSSYFASGEYQHLGLVSFYRGSSFLTKMEKVISMLPLPTSLTADVFSIIGPIMLERLKWMRTFGCTKCMVSPYWTNEGTVDRKKTVEQWIRKDSRHCVEKIFHLASEYCIEISFRECNDRIHFTDYMDHTRINMCHPSLRAYWIHFVKGELPELLHTIKQYYRAYDDNQSIYHNMLTLGVSRGYPMAVRYFWEKLTDAEKHSNLKMWINMALEKPNLLELGVYQETDDCSDVLFFLLSQITDGKEQREIFRRNSLSILKSLFFYWPRQRFLLPTLKMMWDYLDEEVYVRFMSLVVERILEGKGTEKILRQIWDASPIPFRKCFIHNITVYNTDIWCDLLIIKDMDAIHMLLEEMNSCDRMRLPFSLIRNGKLFEVIYTHGINIFDMLVQNTLTTEYEVQALKEIVIMEYGHRLCQKWIFDDNLEEAEMFLSWAFTSKEQINDFKSVIIDKMEIVRFMISSRTNFEFADKFLNWCLSSQKEVHEFKKHFASSEYKIDKIGDDDWANWFPISFVSHWEFQSGLDKARGIILDFEFLVELIHWYCYSEEDVKECKGRFVVSKAFLERFNSFVMCFVDKLSDIEILTRELLTLFFPLEEGVIVELQRKIRYLSHQGLWTPLIKEEHLFRMIDDANNNASLESSAGRTRKRKILGLKNTDRGVLDWF